MNQRIRYKRNKQLNCLESSRIFKVGINEFTVFIYDDCKWQVCKLKKYCAEIVFEAQADSLHEAKIFAKNKLIELGIVFDKEERETT